MNLDEMKNTWDSMDERLDSSMELNRTLLARINFNQLGKELAKPKMLELYTSGALIGYVFYLTLLAVHLRALPVFSITAAIAAISGAFLLMFSILRQMKLSRVYSFGESVTQVQSDLVSYELLRAKLARPELVFTALALVFMWPPIILTGFEVDIFEDGTLFFVLLGISLLLAIPVAIKTERIIRDRVKQSRLLLNEIQKWHATD